MIVTSTCGSTPQMTSDVQMRAAPVKELICAQFFVISIFEQWQLEAYLLREWALG